MLQYVFLCFALSLIPQVLQTDGYEIDCDDGDQQPNPKSCNSFYKCDASGTPILFKCPANLHYSPSKQVCDWPKSAGCTVKSKGSSQAENYATGNKVQQQSKNNGKQYGKYQDQQHDNDDDNEDNDHEDNDDFSDEDEEHDYSTGQQDDESEELGPSINTPELDTNRPRPTVDDTLTAASNPYNIYRN